MIHNLLLTHDDPLIHIKAYGGVKITGVDQAEVACEIEAPQLATLVEEDGHVYITVNSSCSMTVPSKSSLEIEKGMGSVKITGVHNKIMLEKVLGNLVLKDVGEVQVEKVGGNFSAERAGTTRVEKVGGNLILSGLESFIGEKIGGSCKAKDIRGDFSLMKMGGGFKGQDLEGLLQIERLGGSFYASRVTLAGDLHAGGDLRVIDFKLGSDQVELKAGGDIRLEIGSSFEPARFEMRSSGRSIRVKLGEDDLDMGDGSYDYKMDGASRVLVLAAGGTISLAELGEHGEDVVGDLSGSFDYEESPLSDLIRERVNSATRRAEAKVRAAEVRLGQIRERVEKHRGFNIDVDLGSERPERPEGPRQPVPPDSRQAGKKGASDEERLMILQMLQEKKITVDEAEKLFKALED
jgi:hypothetical protein